ncbi:RNA-guided endonuclease InsQ/TnpB family protein [Argonema galeatum]|uniref:RNA-guided endonuclease InsQ/TnpB family protein n=1 Tax=Argonema galeatum TaxID=2942762 RepID=UPI00201348D4|nr:transposase [Argonema galeatum]MCL1467415.1 transposase [Argonema galeatum A003/A1]
MQVILSYKYKLNPNKQQSGKLTQWLDLLRANYNWCLRDRIDGWHQQYICGHYCDLRTRATITPLTCSLVRGTQLTNPWKDGCGKAKKEGEKDKSPKRTAALMQDANLQELKIARPWYQSIDIGVLQQIPARVNEAFNKFFSCAGFPKFKRRHDFKSFSYKPGRIKIKGNKIYLPKIGWMRFYNSRSIPDGFEIKTVTVRQKADGWYVSVRIESKSTPDFPAIPDSEIKTITGCDMGLGKLVYLSDGSVIDNPRFATNKHTRRLMRVRQRRVSRKQKGSKNRSKAQAKVNKLHNKSQQKRESYNWNVANKIVKKADAVAVEDLNISGMMKRCKPVKSDPGRFLPNNQSAKRGLNRSIADAGWYGLTQKLEYLAAKSGKRLYRVNPQYTSQTCSKCGHVDKNSRNGEKFICTNCGHIDDANLQAARNVKSKTIKAYGLNIIKRIKSKMVRRDSSEPVQLSLFEVELYERLSDNTLPQKGKQRVGKNPENNVQLSLWDIKSAIS